jgi:hypothetical protein
MVLAAAAESAARAVAVDIAMVVVQLGTHLAEHDLQGRVRFLVLEEARMRGIEDGYEDTVAGHGSLLGR